MNESGTAEKRSPESATVWAVFCGEANEQGVVEDSYVRAVYDTKEAATSHVAYVTEAVEEVGQLSGLAYWIEEWDVRSGPFDPDDEAAL